VRAITQNDELAEKWLNSIVHEPSRKIYSTAWGIFQNFVGMTGKELIEEAWKDMQSSPFERTNIVKQRLLKFHNYLMNETLNRISKKKGLCPKTSASYVAVVRSFYASYDIWIKYSRSQALPRPRVVNKRKRLKAEDIRKLVNCANSPRDRAIVLTLFQSGMDVSTLCSLTYGLVKEGLENNEHPLKLDLYRQKAGVEYYSFLGDDAIEAIKAYISYLHSKGIELKYDSPLFLKESWKSRTVEGVKYHHIQYILRDLVVRANLMDKAELQSRHFNLVGPHALRESFSSIMLNNGVPDTIVDFLLGHTLNDMSQAYKGIDFEKVKEWYIKVEQNALNISKLSSDFEKIKNLEHELNKEKETLKDKISKLEERIAGYENVVNKFLNLKPEAMEKLIVSINAYKEKKILEEDMELEKEEQAERRESITIFT